MGLMFAVKTLVSALLIAGVSELAKRSSLMAAFLLALPVTSILSFIWIYVETKDAKKIQKLSYEVLYLVIPSLLFFIVLPLCIKQGVNFWIAMGIAMAVTSLGYFITAKII